MQCLSLCSKDLLPVSDFVVAEVWEIRITVRKRQPAEGLVAFGRGIATPAGGDVLQLNLSLEGQWG
jgi:hypothetical protein